MKIWVGNTSMSKLIVTVKTLYSAHIHSHIAFGVESYRATGDANSLKIIWL